MLMERRLSHIYYSTGGYWKGYAAIGKLADRARVTEDDAREWLEKLALWQIYLPAPKYIPRAHWVVEKPNYVHHADLLYLTHDTQGGIIFKYALVVVDVASRYVGAEAISNKFSIGVARAFESIYSRKLKYPRIIKVDEGSEFKGEVIDLMKEHGVRIQRGEPGNHRAQAFAERANRTIADRLYSHQYAQEMLTDKTSRIWKRRLREVVAAINREPRRILAGEKPSDAVDEDEVNVGQVKYRRSVGVDEVRLPPGVMVRYLFFPGEDEGGNRRRATDPIWSIEVYVIARAVVMHDQPVLY